MELSNPQLLHVGAEARLEHFSCCYRGKPRITSGFFIKKKPPCTTSKTPHYQEKCSDTQRVGGAEGVSVNAVDHLRIDGGHSLHQRDLWRRYKLRCNQQRRTDADRARLRPDCRLWQRRQWHNTNSVSWWHCDIRTGSSAKCRCHLA